MKKIISLVAIFGLAISFIACGGGSSGGGSSTVSTLSNLNIEGEWDYVGMLDSCDKQEVGQLIIKSTGDNSFSWTLNIDNVLEENCTFSGPYSNTGVFDASSNEITLEEFENYIKASGLDSVIDPNITSVIFNSASRITVNGDYTTIFTRNDAAFDGYSYSGQYFFTSGDSENCDASGAFDVQVLNSIVSGTATTNEGDIDISGFAIKDGHYSGTTSDGTTWDAVISTKETYGTYKNTKWNCSGTFTGYNTQAE